LSLQHQEPVRSQITEDFMFIDVRKFPKWNTANLYIE
jgi:hypothetical protein